jgi:hypothetical protein
LVQFGFKHTEADHCVYTRTIEGKTSYITVWVDDLLLLTEDTAEMEELKQSLRQKFTITDFGEPTLLIGLEINRDHANRTISISQASYIDRMLRQYGMEKSNPVSTPMDPNVTLTKREDTAEVELDERLNSSFAAVVGSLLYLAIVSRPDIAYPVTRVSQYTSNPGPAHWAAIKRIMRYLNGHRNLSVTYGPTGITEDTDPFKFFAYTDADFTSNPDDRKSMSGYVFLLAGGAISWNSKKQTTVALSSTEAEYAALAHTTRQVIWLRNLFSELGLEQPLASQIFCDNQSAIAISQDP